MANPQLEDGHTEIAHTLVEALARQPLTGQEFRVVLAILRKTYGWKKKQDWLSNGQIATLTGMSRSSASRVVQQLAVKGLIRVEYDTDKIRRVIRFVKDYDLWRALGDAMPDTIAFESPATGHHQSDGEDTPPEPAPKAKPPDLLVVEAWNGHEQIRPTHRTPEAIKRGRKAAVAALKVESLDRVLAAVRNYGDSTDPFWVDFRAKAGWTLWEFLATNDHKNIARFAPAPLHARGRSGGPRPAAAPPSSGKDYGGGGREL